MLIGARAVQGLAGALMAASSLAIITASFAAGPARHRAIGLWGAMNGAGGAAGTLLGGVITQELSWRWVLLINLPIGITAAAVAYFVVADGGVHERTKFDLNGAFSLTVGQLILAYGVVNGGSYGWLSPLGARTHRPRLCRARPVPRRSRTDGQPRRWCRRRRSPSRCRPST